MNERIRELYEQARLQAKSIDADIDPKGWMDLYHQKFAESIVRECMAIAKNREDELENANLLKESNAVGIVKYRIARQFGVKE
jgi:hypothetical protein